MRLAVVGLLSLSVLVGCCAVPISAPQSPYATPIATISFDADVEFTPLERGWIQEAADRLANQTRGYIKVEVHYDLNFWDESSLRRAEGQNILLRSSENQNPAVDFDEEHCCLLGLTRHYDDLSIPLSVYLVVDRIADLTAGSAPLRPDLGDEHRLFVSVTMHEFLHALGIPHVKDNRALMAAGTQEGDPITLQRADYEAFCKVWSCSVRRVSGGRY